MAAGIFLGIGLEYVDAVFQTIKSSDFSQYTITGMKSLGVLFFLINILKKYNEGIAENSGYTWGLSPGELAKNFAVVLLVIFSTQVLGVFDGILVAVESNYRDTAPALIPLCLLYTFDAAGDPSRLHRVGRRILIKQRPIDTS